MTGIVVHRAEPGWFVDQRSLVLGEQPRKTRVEFFVFTVIPGPQGGLGIVGLYFGLIDGELQQLNGKLSFVPGD